MFVVTFLLLLLSVVNSAHSFELTADNSFLLNCPINSLHDYQKLQELSLSGAHPVDIFQEKVSVDFVSMVQLLTDEATSEVLLSRFGCFEEKGRAALKNLFTPSESSETAAIGKEFHQDYRSYQNIIDQLFLYSRQYPSHVKAIRSIGKSVEGKDLFVIHLSSPANQIGTKPLVWIMAGQHAREWISTASTLVLIEELLKSSDQSVLDNYEFAILPLVNPDGYEYSRTVNRMWRKNRKRTGKFSNGVDLNRNWDHKWCELGSSKVPSSDIYCGVGPASEPEISATQAYILSLPTRMIGFDVHSYSQLILRNYGWTSAPTPIEGTTSQMSKRMVENMGRLYGVKYTASLSVGLYPVTGSAEDWLYVKAGIPGFVMEMRDNGQHGFKLPPNQIKPTGKELFVGILTALKHFNQ